MALIPYKSKVILNSHSPQMCGGGFHIYIFIYILNLYTMKGNKSAIIIFTLTFCLFQWKTLCKDNFPCFPLFGSIKKDESKENYL